MDIFISWSGEASHIMGLALKEWLPSVIQSIEPFISSEDIAKGTRWFSEIGTQLGKSNFGIICLTPDNYSEPWILFEPGAISKSIGESSIAPILLGMTISELEGPLSQFNATLANKEDILKLMKSINDRIDTAKDKKLDSQKLEKIFEALWPDLETKIDECLSGINKTKTNKPTTKKKRTIDDILEELIELNRSNTRLLTELPSKLQKEFIATADFDKLPTSQLLIKKRNYRLNDLLNRKNQLYKELGEAAANIVFVNNELEELKSSGAIEPDDGVKIKRIYMLEAKLTKLKELYNAVQQEIDILGDRIDRGTPLESNISS